MEPSVSATAGRSTSKSQKLDRRKVCFSLTDRLCVLDRCPPNPGQFSPKRWRHLLESFVVSQTGKGQPNKPRGSPVGRSANGTHQRWHLPSCKTRRVAPPRSKQGHGNVLFPSAPSSLLPRQVPIMEGMWFCSNHGPAFLCARDSGSSSRIFSLVERPHGTSLAAVVSRPEARVQKL